MQKRKKEKGVGGDMTDNFYNRMLLRDFPPQYIAKKLLSIKNQLNFVILFFQNIWIHPGLWQKTSSVYTISVLFPDV